MFLCGEHSLFVICWLCSDQFVGRRVRQFSVHYVICQADGSLFLYVMRLM